MKPIITSLVIAALAILGSTPTAEARQYRNRTYISGYQSCGTPVYSQRYFIGYDHCGNPVWGKRVVHRQYRPAIRHHYVAPSYRSSRCYR